VYARARGSRTSAGSWTGHALFRFLPAGRHDVDRVTRIAQLLRGWCAGQAGAQPGKAPGRRANPLLRRWRCGLHPRLRTWHYETSVVGAVADSQPELRRDPACLEAWRRPKPEHRAVNFERVLGPDHLDGASDILGRG
jgi:hypothetical protein